MSFRVYFMFSTGLGRTLWVPKGTLQRVREQVAATEKALGLKTEQYRDNPPHWTSQSKRFAGLDDKTVCRAVEEHNRTVRWFYGVLCKASKRKGPGLERLRPADAAPFWHGLELLDVPPERWTVEFYRARMEALYGALRGQEAEGMVFDSRKALTPQQADSVINLIADWLDPGDLRLSVPWRRDELCDSDEYLWCDRCGAIHSDDVVWIDTKDDGEYPKCPRCRKRLD